MWVAERGDINQIKQIAIGENHVYLRVAWTPDRKIVFPSTATGYRELWIMEADGTGQKQLTFDKGNNMLPSVSPDGRFILFTSDRAGEANIWKINIDGTNPMQLTKGKQNFGPRSSPDSKWVLYISNDSGKETIWRVPIDGGEAQPVVDAPSAGPDVSPDGKLIACWLQVSPDGPRKIGIVSWEDGKTIKTFEPMPQAALPPRWTSDGKALIYAATNKGVSNLWKQPVDGGPAEQITDFKSETILGFDWAKDDSLVCSRGYTFRDAVLISDF